MENKKVYTVKDVASLLQVKEITVRRMIARGDLKAFKIGNRFRLNFEDVEKYLKDYVPAKPSS
jgi:putative molybdopterin biosynthesis protein